MRVIRNRETEEERVLALGTFDGVHRGHQALLEAGKQYARERGIRLRACSFDRHPLEVLRPESAPKLLTTLPEGTTVTYLTTMYNSGAWDYIETTIDGKTARGFVPSGYLDIDDVSVYDAMDAMEMMEGEGDG